MNTKHTPGPWTVREHNYGDVRGCHGVFAAGVTHPLVISVYGDSIENSDANARLIAAAPDLLAALIQIRDMDYVPQFAERVAEIARAAIEACEEV